MERRGLRTRGPGGYGTGPQHPDPQGVAVDIAAIESRRQAIKRRMAELRPPEHVRRPRTRQGHDGDVRPVCGIRPEYRRAGGL